MVEARAFVGRKEPDQNLMSSLPVVSFRSISNKQYALCRANIESSQLIP